MAWDKKGLGVALSSDLAFAEAGVGVNAPSDFAGGDVIVTGDFGGDPFALDGLNPDDLFKVAAIVADPLTGEGTEEREFCFTLENKRRSRGGQIGEEGRNWMRWARPAYRQVLGEAEGGADDGFEGLGFVEQGDFDAKKEDGNIAGWKGGEADGIFFCGDEGKAATGAGAGEGVFDFRNGEAMVVGKGALVDDFGAETDQSLHEAFGHGDAGDGADAEATQVGERETFSGEKIFEVKGVMATGVDRGVAIVATNLFFEFGVIFARAFGEQDEIGPAEGIGGFAQDTAGKDVLIAERVLAVDEEEIEAVAEAEILEAVVEKESVGLVVADGVAGGFDAIGIDEDGDAGEIAGEHEGFVASLGGIEQDRFYVGDHAGRGRGPAGEKFIGQAGEEGFGDRFVTAT